jgi:transcriptional antiterminator NusG
VDPSGRWYAVQVRPRFESIVAKGLAGKGYEHFLPLTAKRRAGGRRQPDVPLIPGYVFCRITSTPVAGYHVTTHGVVRILSAGTVRLPIDDAEIEALQRVVATRAPAEPWHGAQVGDLVEIVRGPLAGLTGVLCRFDCSDRLVLSVTMLRRAVAVEVDIDSVRRLCTSTAGHALPLARSA